MSNFLKCVKEESFEKLKSEGYEFMYEDNGTYWFLAKDEMNFTFTESDIEITDTINL